MNFGATREIVARDFSAAVTGSSYSATRIDWSGFNSNGSAPTIPVTGATDAQEVWFRPLVYPVVGTSRPLAIGSTAPNVRFAQLLVSAFVAKGNGDRLGPAALGAVANYLQRQGGSGRTTSSDATGYVSLEYRDADEPEYIGDFGAWAQYNMTQTLRIQDAT